MKQRKQWMVICLIFLLTIPVALWSIEVKEVEERTIAMSSDGTISLVADEGDIVIRSWEKGEVYLKMTKRASARTRREAERRLNEIEVLIREEKDKLVIRELNQNQEDQFNFFDLFDGEFWKEREWRGGVVDFELVVPKRIQLRLKCDEGDIEVSGTEGKLTIDVDEGDVDIEDIVSEQIQVRVDEGDVKCYRIQEQGQGFLRVESDEGRIRIEDSVIEEVDLSADEGKIVLSDVQVSRLGLYTDEGDVVADFQPLEGGRYRMETDEGNVRISIPGDANLEVRLQTDEGRIETDFDLRLQRREEGERAQGSIGSIGQSKGVLKAYTEEGDILLRKKTFE